VQDAVSSENLSEIVRKESAKHVSVLYVKLSGISVVTVSSSDYVNWLCS